MVSLAVAEDETLLHRSEPVSQQQALRGQQRDQLTHHEPSTEAAEQLLLHQSAVWENSPSHGTVVLEESKSKMP